MVIMKFITFGRVVIKQIIVAQEASTNNFKFKNMDITVWSAYSIAQAATY